MSFIHPSTIIIAVFFATAFVLCKLVGKLCRLNKGPTTHLPPGPKQVPLLGNINVRIDDHLHHTVWNHKDEYGDLSCVTILSNHMVFANSVDVIREITHPQNLGKLTSGRENNFFTDFSVRGGVLMRSFDDKCQRIRNLIHSSFQPHSSVTSERVISEEVEALITELMKRTGDEIDLKSYINSALVNTILTMTLGNRYGVDHEISQKFHKFLDDFTNLSDVKTMACLTLVPWLRYVPVGPGNAYKAWTASMNELMRHVFYDIRKQGREIWMEQEGFIYELLRHQEKNTWLTDDDIYGILRDMLIAGVVTSQASLYSLVLYLVHNPHIQTRLQNEIDHLHGNPRMENMKQMPYTQAVILETLRMTSPFPLSIPHVVTGDITVRGFDVPKGSRLFLNLWRVHHDGQLWDDPWTFKPERFLDGNGDLLPCDHPTRRNLIPFGAGKRRCVGSAFSRIRMFLFVTSLCQKFHFHSDDVTSLPKPDPREFPHRVVVMAPSYRVRLVDRT